MKRHSARVGLCLLILLAGASLVAGAADAPATPAELGVIRQEIESLRKEVSEIRKALAEMRQQIAERPAVAPRAAQAPAIVKVSGGNGPSLGKPDAPVTIIEFSDYQCPFCQRFASSTLPELRRDYVDTGKVRYIFRDFPLDNIHPDARKAAEAAHCAGDQGKYWEMHDALFKNTRALKVDSLKAHARAMGLNEGEFDACLDQGKYASVVNEHFSAGSGLGVTGTPSFFIGKTTADGTIEGLNLRGAQPTASFRRVIDQLLAGS
jgi:protein-disulfide isomerase